MALNSRLLKIAEMIRRGDRVADIGTDHAYLPVYLINSGISPLVYACDVSDGPLLNAKSNIEKAGVSGIELRKGNGFAALEPNDADTFVLAGMGGELIISLISETEWIKNPRYELILQPMTSVEDLRRFLLENSFTINEERAVRSAGRIYTVIKAKYSRKKQNCSPLYYYVGKLADNIGDDERVYIRRKLRILKELAESIKAIESEKDRYNSLLQVIEEISGLDI